MNTLGLELISSDPVAITELVKNAFDADAHFVVVRIRGQVVEGSLVDGEIQILDDGIGMDAGVIAATWLEPATANRRRSHFSDTGRRVLGEKGVGRFAAAKLGTRFRLESKARGRKEVSLQLDWTDFEDESKYLDEIVVEWGEVKEGVFGSGRAVDAWWKSVRGEHLSDGDKPRASRGTLLTIGGLRSPWSETEIAELRRSLSRLVSPFAHEKALDSDFQIVLDVPAEFGLSSGPIGPSAELERPHYQLRATVDAHGHARGSLELMRFDRPEQTIDVDLATSGEGDLKCGPFDIRLDVWDRDATALAELADDKRSVKSIRSVLDSAAGVSIYRDGFRVLPYGESGDDWLGLDLRRVQSPTQRLSNNQIVGYVLIGRDENPELADQTNREGLVDGAAFSDLRRAVLQLLVRLEGERYKARPRKKKSTRGGLLDRVDLGELRQAIVAAIPKNSEVLDLVADIQRDLDDRTDKIGEVLSRYHRLATLGQLIDRVVHEVGQPIAAIRQASTLASEHVGTGREALNAEAVGKVAANLATINRQVRSLGDVVRRIQPFGGRRRGRPTRFPIERAIEDAVALLDADLKKIGVIVHLPTTNHEVSLDGTELQEVLVNLLTNSLYWLQKVPKAKRQIEIDVERNPDSSLSVIVEDSGPGIAQSDSDFVFDPYFTTKEDGVGLGLAIAGEIVSDYYDGQLELLPPGDLGGARFRATLRRRVE